jgi:L-alanine-DL-glutamate epimerase-like enolase superfamily enzyme
MKIVDVEVIEFKHDWYKPPVPHKWGYGNPDNNNKGEVIESIIKIITDDGAEGYMIGGDKKIIENNLKPLLIGQNPLEREKIWTWMEHANAYKNTLSLNEEQAGYVDCALWDLFGRMTKLPVHKILGGSRDKVKAYASTFPNMGGPEDYAKHAIACKKMGYKAYKIHAYIAWDPIKWEPAPLMPAFPDEDLEICRAVREAVGDDMVLMLDPFAVYTLQESLKVAKELEKLNFYWLEHPMMETKIEAYRRLTSQTEIAILSPEHAKGGVSTRAEWILQGASDMIRTDIHFGGITGCYKTVSIAQAFGIQCEMHGGGWGNSHLLGAFDESTCEYYEHGLLKPGRDYSIPPIYLKETCDPLDTDGNVILPQKPGLGFDINWDYINDNLV